MTNVDHRSLDRLAALAADTRGDSARIAQVLAAIPALIEAARDRNERIDPDDATAAVQAARREEREAMRSRVKAALVNNGHFLGTCLAGHCPDCAPVREALKDGRDRRAT